MASRCEILCEIILAILIPPLGVCLRHGCCSVEFFICLVLTILGYVPGIIYALYAIVFIDRDRFQEDFYQLA
ncbi:Stress responsive protein [Handroanthus impetiginosus]|uniref:Stress responsive protein n=1 Tax=Handroanthus impetiginosus TaxID=429701 RepID=A0A2G9GSH9_9LAMI|nr:Stress responsive protein [Handroanthus impetiginosus]